MADKIYIGRFAPSPTGPLHFGSLVAALASYLDAKAHDGQWLVRMEDVDVERTRPGAAERILRDLEALGLEWDGPVVYQTARTEAYSEAFRQLEEAGLIYPCVCSRKETAGRYRGTCAGGLASGQTPRSWRVSVPAELVIRFVDRFHGMYSQQVSEVTGDFILRRADGHFAYQLAVVVDDAEQRVTHVVRGADLLDNTPRQIYLQNMLELQTPTYGHIPVATDAGGKKLSKSTGAAALDSTQPIAELTRCLSFLGYEPETGYDSVQALLDWAVRAWQPTSRSERQVG